MFDDYRFFKKFTKMMRICGGNLNNPSIADQVASTIVLFPLGIKDEMWKNNKYMLTDAALLTLLLTVNALVDNFQNELAGKIVEKTCIGIREFYGITNEEFILIQKNRFKVFNTTALLSDTKAYYEEAKILLKEDYTSNRYIEYSSNYPITLIGIFEMYKIEAGINNYFETIMPMISKNLKKE